jgi:predicted dehydrogenase
MSIQTTRRRFLVQSATAAAAFAVPNIVTSRTLAAGKAKRPLRIAQIGCGRIARQMDLPGVMRHPDLARIVAVCDIDSNRAAEAKTLVQNKGKKILGETPDIAVSGHYRELLERDDIDAVAICTPEGWHAQPVIEAALAGKDIYVQKPLTLTIAEGRAASDIVRKNGRILQVGSQQRSTEQFHRACQLVRNGYIGKVHTVKIGLPTDPSGGRGKTVPVPPNLDYDQWIGSTKMVPYTLDRAHPQKGYSRPGWMRLNQFTCGMITGWGAHHLDIAQWGMGMDTTGPISVDAKAQWPGPESFWDVHGPYMVTLKYANGATVIVHDKFPNGIRFEADKGWIRVSRGSYSATKSDPTSGKHSKAFDASNKAWVNSDLSKDEIQLHRSPHWDHHLDWLQAVHARKNPTTNVETGHRANSACMVSWIGMKLGRPLKWDPDKEHFVGDKEANSMTAREERAPYGALRAAKEKAGYVNKVGVEA